VRPQTHGLWAWLMALSAVLIRWEGGCDLQVARWVEEEVAITY